MFTCSAGAVTAEINCEAVVAATLEELALGAASEWTTTHTDVAKSAAGSACLKAASGRYGDDLIVESVAISSNTERTATTSDTTESKGDPEAAETGGIRFKPMTGSPTQKPYERARSVDN
jgi:hypothetical protein